MYVEDIRRALERFGPRLAQIFGQGESPITGTVLSKEIIVANDHPRWLERIDSAGIANSLCEVRVGGADDNRLPPGGSR
jgi:long-chain acyl-CoA synthetase